MKDQLYCHSVLALISGSMSSVVSRERIGLIFGSLYDFKRVVVGFMNTQIGTDGKVGLLFV